MTIKITSNYHVKELLSGSEVPYSLFLDNGQFSYVEPLSDDFYSYRFFNYRGSWWDINEFERAEGTKKDSPINWWDAHSAQSYFDAILVKYPEIDYSTSYEHVIVGYAHW